MCQNTLNDLGEIMQRQLQSLVDQRNKIIETLSNLLKATADLAQEIADNAR